MSSESDAAREVSSQDRLLPGEGSSIRSGDARDAEVWVRVYAELTGFKDMLLEQVAQQRSAVEERGQPEIDSDTALLLKEAERLKRRLRFWESEVTRRKN